MPPVFNAREHLGDDGSFKADWWKAAGVSEGLGKKFTRPEALARSYESLEAKISAKGLIVPGPTASKEERDAFFTALGRPAKPEEYGLTKPDKIGDKPVPDAVWDKDRATRWQAKLHELGVSKDVAQKIAMAATEESFQAYEGLEASKAQMQAANKAALQKEFGTDYNVQMARAARAAQEFGGKELMEHPGLANDPVMIRTLAKIGAAFGERPGAGVRQQAGNDGMTAAEAKVAGQKLTQEIAAKTKADRNWGNSPEAQALKAKKSELFKVAFPEPSR